MMTQALSDAIHRGRRFLGAHPVIRWFVVPILFMGGLLVGFMLAFTRAGPSEIGQIVGLFLAISLLVVVVGLGIERALSTAHDRL